MKKTPLFLLAFAVAIPQSAYAQESTESGRPDTKKGWQVTLSAGSIYAPNYRGDDDYQLGVFPGVAVEYDDLFFASIRGVGFNLINSDGLKAGPIMKYDFGRDEDGKGPFSLSGGTTDLIGLGDVDGTFELGGFVEYSTGNISGKVELRQGINGHEGLQGEAQVKYANRFKAFGKNAILSVGPEISFGDSKYNSAYFDVSAVQSAASGLSQYDASGGLNSYGLGASIVLPMTRHITIVGLAGYQRLAGDIAKSSLVQERGSKDQASVGLILNYRF
ncbi:MipA/OmpV family protein [Parasphingorhabdus sp.]|uniref:MipA/OmpV family protein n=1 Tax=Parasphingorhabdus sp. TaxID=2709688 RepID=UPI003264AAA8